jgi:6,7-dimethyl-8-ribityllumazine synthase
MAGFGDPHMHTVDAAGLRVGIVGARWHADLIDHMIERAKAAAEACASPASPWTRAPRSRTAC